MTIIEAAKKIDTFRNPFEIMDKTCPSDYGFKNMKGCQFRSKGSLPDDMECLRCWTRRCKDGSSN